MQTRGGAAMHQRPELYWTGAHKQSLIFLDYRGDSGDSVQRTAGVSRVTLHRLRSDEDLEHTELRSQRSLCRVRGPRVAVEIPAGDREHQPPSLQPIDLGIGRLAVPRLEPRDRFLADERRGEVGFR